jgi:hypothetical protein
MCWNGITGYNVLEWDHIHSGCTVLLLLNCRLSLRTFTGYVYLCLGVVNVQSEVELLTVIDSKSHPEWPQILRADISFVLWMYAWSVVCIYHVLKCAPIWNAYLMQMNTPGTCWNTLGQSHFTVHCQICRRVTWQKLPMLCNETGAEAVCGLKWPDWNVVQALRSHIIHCSIWTPMEMTLPKAFSKKACLKLKNEGCP